MEEFISSSGVENAYKAANMLSMDASQFGNDASYEYMWAVKTFKYAETHFKLISTFDPSKLRLTKYDDQIYRMFKRYFKNFKVDIVDIESLKTETSKARWRPFCELFKGKVEDYNFGTLLRMDCSKGYLEDNTELVTRIQFLAIELARNRRGLNQFHLNEDKKTDNDVRSDKQTVEKACTVTEEGAESKEIHHAEESKDIECGEEAAQSSSSS
ncbi:protein PBDC1-like [Rhopilema esculentum]|uniref:protein PBDC1-like n=1 Tax=Rhopilema esculentum TaxID=499914 RepID=UPI0031E4377E